MLSGIGLIVKLSITITYSYERTRIAEIVQQKYQELPGKE
jgi:hypothetical protein